MGATPLLHGNSRPDAMQALADKIRGAGGTAGPCVFDLGDDAATAAAVAPRLPRCRATSAQSTAWRPRAG